MFVDIVDGHAGAKRIGHVPDPFRAGVFQLADQDVASVLGVDIDFVFKAGRAHFQAAQGFLHRFLEGAADRHHLTHGFHLRVQARIRFGEFLEGKARNFGDDVIDRRFERGRGGAAGDFVAQFVQRVTHREFRGDFSNREAGGFRRERG